MPKYPMWILMAALTQVSRLSVLQPEAYPVPWLPLYGLSVAVLLSIGAKKILRPRKKRADEDADGEPKAIASENDVAPTPSTEHVKAS